MTADLADYDHDHIFDIPSSVLIVFVLSTYGEGGPPDNGIAFLSALHELRGQGRKLNNIRYVMFGLGNSNYTHYNQFAIDVDKLLLEMDATRVGILGLGDDRNGSTEEDYAVWKKNVGPSVAKTLGVPLVLEKKHEYTPRIRIRPVKKNASRVVSEASPLVYQGVPTRSPTTDGSPVVVLPIAHAERIDYSGRRHKNPRECVHIEFNLENHPSVTYGTGDYLLIWPMNPEDQVESLLQALGVWDTHRDVIDISSVDSVAGAVSGIPSPATIESLFRCHFDICAPVSREFMSNLVGFINDKGVKHMIDDLTRDRDIFHRLVTSRKLTLAAVLKQVMTTSSGQEDRSCLEIPLSYVLENLKRLQPRGYSISSSATASPRRVSITALAVTDTINKEPESLASFRGVTSHYLLQLQQKFCRSPEESVRLYAAGGPGSALEAGQVFAQVRRSNFKLPEDPSVPVLMVASGTGVAPFRAFVQERMKLETRGTRVGKMILVVGHRAPDHDYYYHQLWEEAREALGADKFEIHTAFSRAEHQPRQYVQDVLVTKPDILLDLFSAERPGKGVIYICGSSAMANSVRACLKVLWSPRFESMGGTADEWLKELGRTRRLQEDSWG